MHFTPDVQARLEEMARESGRPSEELVEDAVLGYFDEVAHTREMLDRRFDDLESGSVKSLDGEEAFRLLMEKNGPNASRANTDAAGLVMNDGNPQRHTRPVTVTAV